MEHKVVAMVGFTCAHCQSDQLMSKGAGRTDHDHVYVVYQCLGCGESVPIDVMNVMTELYHANGAPPSKLVH